MWLFALFIAVPLIEIALFIQIGGLIGLWPTLLVVVVTALIGTYLVRSQGAEALAQLRRSFDELRDPTEPLAHGAMILFSGALLLTPGFFTDAVGFALLMPPVRRAVYRYVRARVKVHEVHYGSRRGAPSDRRPGPDVIDGEYEEIDPAQQSTHRPDRGSSGWTRH